MKHKLFTIAILFVLLFTLTGCDSFTPDPTPHPTVTAPPVVSQTFTARVTVGAVEVIRTDTIYLGSLTINYVVDENDNIRAPIDYVSPICYMTPGNVCDEKGAADLLITGVMLRIESGCWTATKAGQDYTLPVPC